MMLENHLSTNATFPITYGTAITVECDPQYLLLRSSVITCEKGIIYSYHSLRPKCVNRGKYQIHLLLIFVKNFLYFPDVNVG